MRLMILFAALALLPFILLIIASFTDNQWATVNGFSFWPAKWSHGGLQLHCFLLEIHRACVSDDELW